MCLGNHMSTNNSFDQISNNPLKDLYELIDAQNSPVNNNCNYISPDDVKLDNLSLNGSQITVHHLNIHSVPSKLDDLKTLLAKLKTRNLTIDVILLCETFITDNKKESCSVDDYKLFSEHRKNMSKGGVAIYVHKTLKYKERDDLRIFDEGFLESCFIELTMQTKNIIVGEIYRVPGTSEGTFITKYEDLISKIKREKKILLLAPTKT